VNRYGSIYSMFFGVEGVVSTFEIGSKSYNFVVITQVLLCLIKQKKFELFEKIPIINNRDIYYFRYPFPSLFIN
jgi:hypothetical protein